MTAGRTNGSVMSVDRAAAAGRAGKCGCVEDFFVLSAEHFVARYYRLLAQLSFADRRLVLGVKYKLAFTLEHVCPPNAALLSLWQCNNGSGSNGHSDLSAVMTPRALLATSTDAAATSTTHQLSDTAAIASAAAASMSSFDSRFARCYFMVTSMVSYTDHDYHKILQQQNNAGRKCNCDGYGTCKFCQTLIGLARKNEAARDPYRPPNPHDWIKSRALVLGENNDDPRAASFDSMGGRDVGSFGTHSSNYVNIADGDQSSANYQTVLARFRCQNLRTDVYAAIKRARVDLGGSNVPVKKFRTESLPSTLLYATKHRILADEFSQKDLSGVFNRDLASLLSHFSINWCKLHYLEPSIFPAHGDC